MKTVLALPFLVLAGLIEITMGWALDAGGWTVERLDNIAKRILG